MTDGPPDGAEPDRDPRGDSAPAAAEASVDPSDPYERERQTFPVLGDEQVARIAAHGREERVEDGTIVLDRGDRSVDLIPVLQGAVELFDMGEGARRASSPPTGRAGSRASSTSSTTA